MKVAFGSFTFDSDTRELVEAGEVGAGEQGAAGAGQQGSAGTRVHLSPKAFDLLHLLLARRPAVVSKHELQEHLWPGTYVSEANLTVVVSEVRQALRDEARQARLVRTVHRVGYAFCGEAREVEGAGPTPLCWLTHEGRSLPLVAGENVVGRDPRCAVWVDRSGVSRRHARIDVGAEGATIEDLGSSNGTYVAGQRLVGPRALADGEAIELGAATVVFHAWSDEGAPRTERIRRP